MDFVLLLWRGSKPLTAVGLAMVPLFLASLAGIALDPRIITGAPAWLKPAKFAISIGIYVLSLAWVYSYLSVWPALLSGMAWITAIAAVTEIVIIDGQAFRGTTSHFNIATPLDAALFATMGLSIAVLWVASVVVCIALFRQNFPDPLLGRALQLGMLLTVLGSASGVLMVSPGRVHDAAQRSIRSGAHTVGASDGGPGLPGTGWSTQHGDLRVPHFLGLHGVQVLPLLALLLVHFGVMQSRGLRLINISAASYLILYVILLRQSMYGESVVSPSTGTLISLGVWLALTMAGVFFA